LVNSGGSTFDYGFAGFAVDNIKVYAPKETTFKPISKVSPQKQISIHPNPFINQFEVRFSREMDVTLNLYNALGKRIDRIYSNGSVKEIQVNGSDMRSGIYILEIVNEENGEIVEKRKIIAR
jgi:hypothetical protein